MVNDFSGKTALVTGGGSGIGLATARMLAVRGIARLVVTDWVPEGLAALDDLPCDVVKLVGDVANERLWEGASETLTGLDLALINAGVSGSGEITDLDFGEWRRVLETNLDGAFLTLRAAMRAMKGKGGAIVVMSSATGLKAEVSTAAYGASKAGLMQLMRVAAKEGAVDRIRVNAIAPAGVETAMWRTMPFFAALVSSTGSEEAAFAQIAGGSPLGRFASAEEIAAQVAFLMSDAAATITGATLTSDGGYLL